MRSYSNTELRIECAVSLKQLNQIYIKEKVNTHMYFSITGIVSPEDAKIYEKRKLLGDIVRIYDCSNNQEEALIGCGIISKADLYIKGNTHYIRIQGTSASRRFDTERKKRSFQNPDRTYGEIVSMIAEKDREIFYRHDNDRRLDVPVIQYEETDWELLKRLAGRLNTVLIPDTLSGKCIVYMGKAKCRKHHLAHQNDRQYRIHNDSDGKFITQCISEQSLNMRLGDDVIIDNREWTVVERQFIYKRNRLERKYTLGRIKDWSGQPVYNTRLSGASIRGKVIKVKGEYLKLQMDFDREQDEKDAYWFPYLPETGNIMYAMPEPGSEVVIYFPDNKEENGIATHGFLSNTKNLKHEIKQLKTPYNKKIKFWPDEIEISGGKSAKINMINIGDHAGARFSTQKAVYLAADEEIIIQSALSCSVAADNRMTISQTGGKNRIEMMGNQIAFRAENYRTASPIQKSTKPVEELDNSPADQTFSSLYGAFAGMMAQGDCGDINGKILGGIPIIGSVKGDINIQKQLGISSRRK